MMSVAGKSLTVIGAGAIGLSVAYFARRAGFDVTVIDRGAPDDARCSHGNAGMIVPSHFEPLASPGMLRQGLRSFLRPSGPVRIPVRFDPSFIRWCWHFLRSARHRHVEQAAPILRDLLLESRELFATLAARHGNAFDLQHRGVLMICATADAFRAERHAAEIARRLGIAAEVLDAAAVRQREKQTEVKCVGGVYYPLDAHLQPLAYCQLLERELQHSDVRFAWHTDVQSLRADGERVAAIASAGVCPAADEIVVAAGAWSDQLLGGIGVRLPLQAGKGYSLTVAPSQGVPSVPAMLVEARVAVTPWSDRVRFAGSMEFMGVDMRLDPDRLAAFRARILGYYTDLNPALLGSAQAWSGLRPCTPDGLPYIGRVAQYSNLSVVTGHAMLGISLSPVTGRILADALLGNALVPHEAMLDPARFG